ncbi:MAG: hypothetical protein GQ570_11440 [Helicobacteraceae bacterium]|nr:hypothetical protein [Helicobacteraceae bacterium]
MKYSVVLLALASLTTISLAQGSATTSAGSNEQVIVVSAPTAKPQAVYNYNYNYDVESDKKQKATPEPTTAYNNIHVSVTGEGVAPVNTASPAQAYALAKRAAIAEAYRLIAEKVKGIHIEGQDYIKNMMVKSTTVRSQVNALVRNATIIETTFKDGLCEVEMEIVISQSQFMR